MTVREFMKKVWGKGVVIEIINDDYTLLYYAESANSYDPHNSWNDYEVEDFDIDNDLLELYVKADLEV